MPYCSDVLRRGLFGVPELIVVGTYRLLVIEVKTEITPLVTIPWSWSVESLSIIISELSNCILKLTAP